MRSSLIIKNRDLLFLILRLQISRSDKDGLISTPYLRTEGVRCRNGPCPRWQPGRVAVPQDDGVCVNNGVRRTRPQASSGDSHGLLCRDRRVVGTKQRVRGGRKRQDRARGEGGERAGSVGGVLPGSQPGSDTDRSGGGSLVAVAACRSGGGRVYGGDAGNPARQGSAVGDDGQDRP